MKRIGIIISSLALVLAMAVAMMPMLGQDTYAEASADKSSSEYRADPQSIYSLSDSAVTIVVDSVTYSGKNQVPNVKVYYYQDLLLLNRDYTLQFTDSKGNTTGADTGICKAGKYSMTITGMGNYSGTDNLTVIVKAAPITTVKVNKRVVTYNGRKHTKTIKVKARVNGSVKTLKRGTDYTVAYKNNKNVGKATITIKGKGNYSGAFKRTFKIRPRATWFRFARAQDYGVKVKWAKKTKQVSGYQIQYSRKSSFAQKKTINIKRNKTISKAVKNLIGGKKYYVRVRTYKTVNGKKYFSKWSAKKRVKARKPALKKYIQGKWKNVNNSDEYLIIKGSYAYFKMRSTGIEFMARGLKVVGKSTIRATVLASGSYEIWKVTSIGRLKNDEGVFSKIK